MDDALHARALPPRQHDGAAYEVGVHIADVSHFVTQGSMLDGEAASRCTSVYLSDRRLDMLPGVLSGNLCSLLSNVDRLAVSVVWRLDSDLEVISAWFGRTIIRSRYKLHYQQAQDVLDGSTEPTPAPGTDEIAPQDLARVKESLEVGRRRQPRADALTCAHVNFRVTSALLPWPFVPCPLAHSICVPSMLPLHAFHGHSFPALWLIRSAFLPYGQSVWSPIPQILARVAGKARARRVQEGALELASAEMRFELNGPDKTPLGVQSKKEIPMMGVVAEMMILANSWVARRIHAAFPTCALLRRHAPPRERSLEEIKEVLGPAGALIDGSSGAALQRSIDRACEAVGGETHPAAVLVRALVTRAMSEALYFSTGDASDGISHFGLALEHYTHFTSPIRRYADVVVHRQLLRAVGQDDATPEWRTRGLQSPAATAEGGSGTRGEGQPGGRAPAAVMPHKDLAEAADAMNARHRESKRASKECSELFLLVLLRDKPMVEPAVVCGVRSEGVVVFVPKFHIKAAVALRLRDGSIRLPERGLGEPQDAPAGTRAEGDPLGGLFSVVGPGGEPVATLRLMEEVWVRLGAHADRTHGPMLRVTILDEDHPDVLAVRAERVGLSEEPVAKVDFR